jgi:hypothetical protein
MWNSLAFMSRKTNRMEEKPEEVVATRLYVLQFPSGQRVYNDEAPQPPEQPKWRKEGSTFTLGKEPGLFGLFGLD